MFVYYLSTCMQASCPLMAAMWAGVHPLVVVTVASAPCQSNQWTHWREKENDHQNSYACLKREQVCK